MMILKINSGEVTSDGNIVVSDVTSILDNRDPEAESKFTLPPHHHCGSHMLTLVAVSDSEGALKDGSYKKLSRGTFSKCSALWNKAS